MYSIDISPLFPLVNEGLKVLLAGGVICIMGYVTWLLHTKAPKFIDAQTQAKLAEMVNRGLNAAVQYALNTVEAQEKTLKPTTDSKITQIGADYAIRHMGDTLAKMGKTPTDIAEMIVARLPTPPASPFATPLKAVAVEVAPLPPVPNP